MKNILFLLLLLVSEFPVFAQNSDPRLARLDKTILDAMQKEQLPGLALAVIQDGKVVLMKGYGVREQGKPDLVDAFTPFMIASNSKAFTGTAISMLEYEGKLKLDDKIVKWLPDFKLHDPDVSKMVTIRDMLTHHLGTSTFQGDFTYWSSTLTRDQVIYKMRYMKPKWDFRTRYGYCNSCFLAAGEAMEAAIGQSWEDHIMERFVRPLEMQNVHTLSVEMMNDVQAARPHTVQNGRLLNLNVPDIDNLAPAASLSMSVSDLSHWLMMQLDTGRYQGIQVFPKEVILKTWNAHTITNPVRVNAYGLGWVIDRYANYKRLSHTGGADGFVSATAFIPEKKLGVIVLTNSDVNGIYYALKDYLLDIYLGIENEKGLDEEINNWQAEQAKEKSRIATLQSRVTEMAGNVPDLKAYAGKYRNDLYGYVEVTASKNQLMMQLEHHPTSTATLEWMGNDTFMCTFANPTLGIQPLVFKNEQGKIKGLQLKVNDFVEYDTYDFVKE